MWCFYAVQSGYCHVVTLLLICDHRNGIVRTLPAQKLLQVRRDYYYYFPYF